VPDIDPLSDAAFFKAVEYQEHPDQGDKILRVRFYSDEIADPEAEAKEGRPMFKTVEMVEIQAPGDKYNIVAGEVRHMTPDPRKRFPIQYAQFRAGDKVQVTGTLLRQWGLIDQATAKSYEAAGVYTVEQLAALPDQNLIRGAIADRQKAKDFLDMAKGQAPLTQARAENQAMKEQLDAMREQLAELTGLLNQRTDPKKGKG
jgi:hypothetical protein